jgi:hypothetical protein
MTMASEKSFRLVTRGGIGLACDKDGVALGKAELVRRGPDLRGALRYEVRPVDKFGRILRTAYGPQPDEVIHRLHRGLRHVAASIEAGDLCRAGVGAVLLGFPDLKPAAMAKLAEFAELEKDGSAWQNEPRIPAGQAGGGQWTTGGGASTADVKPDRNSSRTQMTQPERPARPLDDGVYRPAVDQGRETSVGGAATAEAKPTENSSRAEEAPRPWAALSLDDGVYRPGVDDAHLIQVGGAEYEDSRGSNGPPPDFTQLEDAFPGLKNVPGLAAPLAPIDGFLGISEGADQASLEATLGQYYSLIAQIKAVDPKYVDQQLLPADGIAGLSWQGRSNLIDSLLMQRAVTFYKLRGVVGPLQVETFRFLQGKVDTAYTEAEEAFNNGKLRTRLSREEAIGNYIDKYVRYLLKREFNDYGLVYGPRADITINNRDYDTPAEDGSYTIPDARIRDVSFDWTLTMKTIATPQIRGFFGANSLPRAVVIVRPSQLGQNATYLIPRPATLKPWR